MKLSGKSEKICTKGNIMSKIGKFIKEKRKENNLKQEDLALYAGVSTKFISQLENGKETLKLDKINQVLSIFDCELTPTKKD